MIEADSTVSKTVAPLMASFQISDRVASRLQCSVAKIWAVCGPQRCPLAAAALSRGVRRPRHGRAFRVLAWAPTGGQGLFGVG
jgi:hypothetical protein